MLTGPAGGGTDTLGPGITTNRQRRRRREQMDEDDSSDLSDESDDDADQQRAAQQIKFAKMPVRHRSGSSPIQSSNLRQASASVSASNSNGGNTSSPRATPALRRGSQSALETVKERVRRDTVTSSDISSENEFDASGFHRQREAANKAAARAAKLQAKIGATTDPVAGVKRQESDLLDEELEDEDDDSDASDTSSALIASIDSASILDAVENPLHAASPTQQVVGTPPRVFTRQSTIRRSQAPPRLAPQVLEALPPPRPISTLRPTSMVPPRSLITAALRAKMTKPAGAFESFALLSGPGEADALAIRVYVPFSTTPSKPMEILMKRKANDRPVIVAELIGLSLWKYQEANLQPPLPADKLNVNWYTLRLADEEGEVDDDFPQLERKKPLTSFTLANNSSASRGGGRGAKPSAWDDFALMLASEEEFESNQMTTPEYGMQQDHETTGAEGPSSARDEDATPKNSPRDKLSEWIAAANNAASERPRPNPLTTTTFRPGVTLADSPAPPPPSAASQHAQQRGHHKLLRIHIMSSDAQPGQLVTLDVTTDMYLAEVLDLVCRKRQLDKAAHVLKIPRSGEVVLIDRTVSSIGNVTDLELYRRRFATDGPLTLTGSPSSSSPNPMLTDASGALIGASSSSFAAHAAAARRAAAAAALKRPGTAMSGSLVATSAPAADGTFSGGARAHTHPLAQEALRSDDLEVVLAAGAAGTGTYRRYTVWRKQQLRFVVGMNERIFVIDGEYVHVMPSSNGRALLDAGAAGKTTTVHFSNIIGCKVLRRHPTNFKVCLTEHYSESSASTCDLVGLKRETCQAACELLGKPPTGPGSHFARR